MADPSPTAAAPLLEVSGLRKVYPIRRGIFQRAVGMLPAVDGIRFHLARGETLGIVGESGSGKTTAGRSVLRLVEPDSGTIVLRPKDGPALDVHALEGAGLRAFRRHAQMVFQDPQSFLNPRMTVGECVAEPLVLNRVVRGRALDERVAVLLEEVGLTSAEMRRYPHALSGGQKQRVGIARALALRPELVIADEPVSALDTSIRAQILDLLASLKTKFGLSYLFIAHDLAAVARISDRIAVMYLGKIVEMGSVRQVFAAPKHPYTEALLASIPAADPGARRAAGSRIRLAGEIPSAAEPPSGCRFHPRCAYAKDVCTKEEPALETIAPGVEAACHFASELTLLGVRRESPPLPKGGA